MTHVEVIHRVKNRKCGWSRISEGKLGCKVQSLNNVYLLRQITWLYVKKLKSYARRSYKGAYQNRILGRHK